MGKWIKMMLYVHTHTMKCYTTIKKDDPALCDNMMDLEGVILSKLSQTKKDKYHIISVICVIKKIINE